MVKKIVALAFVAALMVSATACGLDADLSANSGWGSGATTIATAGVRGDGIQVTGTAAVSVKSTDAGDFDDVGPISTGDGAITIGAGSANFTMTTTGISAKGGLLTIDTKATAVTVTGDVFANAGLTVQNAGGFTVSGDTTVKGVLTVKSVSTVSLNSLSFDLAAAHSIVTANAGDKLAIGGDVIMGTAAGAGVLTIVAGADVEVEGNLTLGSTTATTAATVASTASYNAANSYGALKWFLVLLRIWAALSPRSVEPERIL